MKTLIDRVESTDPRLAKQLSAYDHAFHIAFAGLRELAKLGNHYAVVVYTTAATALNEADQLSESGDNRSNGT